VEEEMIETLNNILADGDAVAMIIFFGLVLPGLISLTVFRQLTPSQNRAFGSSLFEAATFGGVNLILTSPLSFFLYQSKGNSLTWWLVWLLAILLVIVMPIVWPFLVRWLVVKGVKWGLLKGFEETGWDAFFSKKKFAFIIVHLNDGGYIGGWFGPNSFASSSPKQGHIYLESLWELDENNAFTGKRIEKSKGVILEPSDYMYIELIEPTEKDHNAK
jgi:hypothetical protein